MKTSEKTNEVIKKFITSMTDGVLNNVLVKDPFIPEKHYTTFE